MEGSRASISTPVWFLVLRTGSGRPDASHLYSTYEMGTSYPVTTPEIGTSHQVFYLKWEPVIPPDVGTRHPVTSPDG